MPIPVEYDFQADSSRTLFKGLNTKKYHNIPQGPNTINSGDKSKNLKVDFFCYRVFVAKVTEPRLGIRYVYFKFNEKIPIILKLELTLAKAVSKSILASRTSVKFFFCVVYKKSLTPPTRTQQRPNGLRKDRNTQSLRNIIKCVYFMSLRIEDYDYNAHSPYVPCHCVSNKIFMPKVHANAH